ncbi:MAG TPA: MarR family transcriptional regulator [Anaeromyxobacteraceae bacterium]|nr:MarR family transcriptional regulator [Anaeromyxobacteraceae bacterium]
MAEYVGLLIGAARRRIKQSVLVRAGRHGLSAQQFWFLVAVAEAPGASQSEVCARLRSDPPTVSRVYAALERRRLVRTAPDPADRRRTCLFLTIAGERLAPHLAASAREIRAAVTRGMSEREVDQLRRGLRRVVENLDRLVDGAVAPPSSGDGRRSA